MRNMRFYTKGSRYRYKQYNQNANIIERSNLLKQMCSKPPWLKASRRSTKKIQKVNLLTPSDLLQRM